MNYKIIVFAIILFLITRKKMFSSKYFKISEFESKDGAPMPDFVKSNISELIKNMDVIREYIKEPIYINSGYRSPDHNKNVNGAKNSFHTKGMACDFRTKNFTPIQLKYILEDLIVKGKIKQGGIGLYANFLHYDIRGFKARW
jgi:uncharacterized protein YcbK (DUF882 family)